MLYTICERVIRNKQYISKEDIQTKIDAYFLAGRLTAKQKEELDGLLIR